MTAKTTNYRNTFIALAPDCPAKRALIPPVAAKPSIAWLQYELLHAQPYALTSDEILFAVQASRTGIPEAEWKAEWKRYFQKELACLRASPLPKRYGWGIHHDGQGRVALVGIDSPQYDELVHRDGIAQKSALRSSRR